MIRVEPIEYVRAIDCPDCGPCQRVAGRLFDDETSAGGYTVDLHGAPHDFHAWVALGTVEQLDDGGAWRNVMVLVEAWEQSESFVSGFRSQSVFPEPHPDWSGVGHLLSRDEALASQSREWFFHLVDHVLKGDLRVVAHLEAHGWRFSRPANTMVFSIRQIVHESASILHVSHDYDDDWQFLGWEDADPKDGVLVHLGHIVDLDPSVETVADLPVGWHAWRERQEDPWQREPLTD